MRGAGRRRAADRPPPPTPTNVVDPWQYLSTPVPGRESDASFCSSRPSFSSAGRPSVVSTNISDRSYQVSALRTINSYLASQSVSFSLKHPLPSAKDITETLKILLHRLGFASQKIEEDLTHALKVLRCPHKLNKSALRAPGTPHSWPALLAVIHWLVQIIKYNDFTVDTSPGFEGDKMLMYTLNSYLLYIRGDDEAVDALDEECMGEMTEWRDKVEEDVKSVTDHVKELEAKLEDLKSKPSPKEELEQKKAMMEKDVEKFHELIGTLDKHVVEVQKIKEEKERALEAKVEEMKRICGENEELKKKIEDQGINMRDAERMKRELQAVERDIEEAEAARNSWEEKIWELDSEIGHKFKELERLVMDLNQAIRRLKLGNGFQYQLNAKGSTPSEVLGLDYKTVLKPALASFADDIKRSSMGKLEELISLRQVSSENAAKLEDKRNQISALQSHIDKVEAQLNVMRNEMHEYVSRCTAEAKRLSEEVEMEAQKMSAVEKEAADFFKKCKAEFQETVMITEEEIKMCAEELFKLVNLVSSYKEHVGANIARMNSELVETAGAVANIYKRYRPSLPVNSPSNH
ncbi:hypothetical protein ACS0TY_011523 [Phlomoides rotata]